jgi:hypothetical protein
MTPLSQYQIHIPLSSRQMDGLSEIAIVKHKSAVTTCDIERREPSFKCGDHLGGSVASGYSAFESRTMKSEITSR